MLNKFNKFNVFKIKYYISKYILKHYHKRIFFPWKGLINTYCLSYCLACHEGCACYLENAKGRVPFFGLFSFELFLF